MTPIGVISFLLLLERGLLFNPLDFKDVGYVIMLDALVVLVTISIPKLNSFAWGEDLRLVTYLDGYSIIGYFSYETLETLIGDNSRTCINNIGGMLIIVATNAPPPLLPINL